MLYISLKNGYRFTANVVREDINAAFEATLKFEDVTPPTGTFTAVDVVNNFTEENLSVIKVYSDSGYNTLIATYSIYKYLNGFSKILSSESGAISTMTLGAKKLSDPISLITG